MCEAKEPVLAASPRVLQVERLGRVAYEPMLALQQARHAEVLAGRADDTLFLLEHDPVITKGRNFGAGNVLASGEMLASLGVALHEVGRGGDVTYHGPGQLVGYPVLHLCQGERDVRRYVCNLEEILIRTAADFGIAAQRIDGLRGIFVGHDKLAAIGVRLSRWTTMHGFALNVNTKLSAFDLIVPCGLRDKGVTSMQRLLGHEVAMSEVEQCLIAHAQEVFKRVARHAPDACTNRGVA